MDRQKTGMRFVEEAFELRDNTEVGETIKFKCDKWEDSDKTIKGKVLFSNALKTLAASPLFAATT